MASSADYSGVEEGKSSEEPVKSIGVNDTARKIFIGGLSQETDSDKLREYFSSYGDIDKAYVKMDELTGNSRGFGFVVFKTPDTVQKVMGIGSHTINSKTVDVQIPKMKQGKIFVGGLDERASEEDIRAHFTTYGTVVDVERPYDKVKRKKKAFCFVVFEDHTVVHTALKEPKQTINGKQLDVKRANPQTDQRGAQGMFSGYTNVGNSDFAYPMQGGWYGENGGGYQAPNYNNGYVAPGSVNGLAQPMRGGGKVTPRGRGRLQPY